MAKNDPTPFDEYHAIAQRLKTQRLNKKLTRQKVAQSLQLPVETIAELESLKQRSIPKSNIVGLYKKYAALLHVEIEPLLVDIQPPQSQNTLRAKPSRKRTKRTFVASKVVAGALVLVILLSLLFYGIWQLYVLIDDPALSIEQPAENSIVLTSELAVSGSVASDSSLLINGEPAPIMDDGRFEVMLYLQPGYNQITFSVINSFSRQHSETRTVFFEKN